MTLDALQTSCCLGLAWGDVAWALCVGCGIAGFVFGALVAAFAMRRRLVSRERRTLAAERRAQQAERLAELGSMTSGLAHEIKNPLSTVVLNAQLLGEEIADSELPEDSKQRLARRADALGREANRLRDILTDFLRFAGRIKLDPESQDIRPIVEEIADFFVPQSDRNGVVQRVELPSEPLVARFDRDLLKQAVLNLLINAVQAMAEQPPARPRELILRVERSGPRAGAASDQSSEVRIHVIDTGPGIEASRRDAIFRPYMTSKPGGTGLGLATTRRIVEEHGGRIQLWTEPGKGSDFTICLPVDGPRATADAEPRER
ncbi:MAG: ATP-binding protein [Phycisphaerales bacterium]